MDNSFFKVLTKEEEVLFRQWARDNYKAGDGIPEIWHPVIREECKLMCEEAEND